MNNQQNIAITRQTVLNFRFFDVNAMMALAADLSLSLTVRELLLIRDHFRVRECRDPMVGELQLLSGLVSLWKKSHASIEVTEITDCPELSRVLADMLRMRNALGHEPATLSVLMNTASRYLARSGLAAYHKSLLCGPTAEMAARAAGADLHTVLDMGSCAAMLAPTITTAAPRAQMLMLLYPTDSEPFPQQIARFLAEHRELGLSAMAMLGDEGLFPHLLTLRKGVLLDLFPFKEQDPTADLSTVLSLGQGTLLFCAPEGALSRLFATGAPVVACGVLTDAPVAQLRKGPDVYLSLSLEIFAALQEIRPLSLHATKHQEHLISSAVTVTEKALLGGVSAGNGCVNSLLSLIGEMLAQGADPDRMTLTAMLELPPLDACGCTAAAAIPLIADLHRIQAELALPLCAPKIRESAVTDSPTITVFVCAERTAPRVQDENAAWQEAAKRQDYVALRRLLRPDL